jgi:hypothetical protein
LDDNSETTRRKDGQHMSEFSKAVREREAAIDRRAADLVRGGMAPWEAMREASQTADDDAQEAATGFRPMRVRPMMTSR